MREHAPRLGEKADEPIRTLGINAEGLPRPCDVLTHMLTHWVTAETAALETCLVISGNLGPWPGLGPLAFPAAGF